MDSIWTLFWDTPLESTWTIWTLAENIRSLSMDFVLGQSIASIAGQSICWQPLRHIKIGCRRRLLESANNAGANTPTAYDTMFGSMFRAMFCRVSAATW